MIIRIIYIVLTLVLALCSCSERVTAEPDAVFDDFSGQAGSAPNPAYWNQIAGTGWDTGIENYSPANAFVDGQGNLVLKAVNAGSAYTSGGVQTKNKLS